MKNNSDKVSNARAFRTTPSDKIDFGGHQLEQMNLAPAAAALGQWSLNLAVRTASHTLRHNQISANDAVRRDWTYGSFLGLIGPAHGFPLVESNESCVNIAAKTLSNDRTLTSARNSHG